MRKKGSTFILEIKDTQSQSWQGTIRWIEGQKEESFRSVLELITLLDSAVAFDRRYETQRSLMMEGNKIPQIVSGI